MVDTTQIKKDIRDIVKQLSSEFNANFYEGNIIGNKESRKYHGVSNDNTITLFVCSNELQEGKIKAGQRAAIFEKCYWLSLSKSTTKILVFTNSAFYNKFVEEYSDYLEDIQIRLFNK